MGGFRQRGRIIDAWAALLTGTGVDHEGRRADQPVLHGRRRLDRQQLGDPRLVEPTAKLGEPFREDNMRLGAIHLDLADPTGIHHGHIRPHTATAWRV